MSQVVRQQINGTTGQDIRKINDNTEAIFEKVHGDINFGDTDSDTQSKIMTQWLPVQQEGNFDANYSMDIRFFIPPNVTKVKSTSFNINVVNYRMDSDVAISQAQSIPVSITSSVGTNSIIASLDSTAQTSLVSSWGNYDEANYTETQGLLVQTNPTLRLMYQDAGMPDETTIFTPQYGNAPFVASANADGVAQKKFAPCYRIQDTWTGRTGWYVDLAGIQHKHNTSHTHTLIQSPHGHSMTASATIPPHGHDLREGVKVSVVPPENVVITLNGIGIANMGYGNPSLSGLDVKDYVKVGQWNVINCSTSNLARMVFYGIIEIELKN